MKNLRIAIIGQSQFGTDVYKLLRKQAFNVVGIFTIPDTNGKPDMLATAGNEDGVPVFKWKSWRLKGEVRPEVLEKYKSVSPNLNVLAFCSQFIPLDVVNYPENSSICYHPSILPVHKGASAINWTLINGDKRAGFSIFYPDDGLDTGDILLQESFAVDKNDTLDSLYNNFLFPAGVKAMGRAVRLISEGKAPREVQSKEGSTYDPMMKKDIAIINWNKTALEAHNFVRGCDRVPGAWCLIDGKKATLLGSSLWDKTYVPLGDKVKLTSQIPEVGETSATGIVHKHGLYISCSDGNAINVKQIQDEEEGRLLHASQWGKPVEVQEALKLNAEEESFEKEIRVCWSNILNMTIEDLTSMGDAADFFKLGAGSMDVVRLVEEINFKDAEVKLSTEDVYSNKDFGSLIQKVVRKKRGLDGKKDLVFRAHVIDANKMSIRQPTQLFIDGEFCDSVKGADVTFDTINPTTGEVICKIAKACSDDVDYAVAAAQEAYRNGPWGTMNARDRGNLMHRLADLMDQHKEELATIETLDSGAVYTLAVKTHVGMSVDTFRYFAGWCDKIEGSTIPINHARPKSNLTFTKREPVGVCAIVIPWNYPLMMLAWKMAACLAAGNVVVLKPAQVTPLTALKFAELTSIAGFPPGVINILPGPGAEIGRALAEHSDVRKIGFTGSTGIGKEIMRSAAISNVKKVSLELGGKSPLIILDDCDFEKAVRIACQAVFFNKGENCIAAGRIFVQDGIHDQFLERVIEEVGKMKIGDPLDRSVDHGPQNHKAHMNKLIEYCRRGKEDGARLILGGGKVSDPALASGMFFEPTIFADVTDDNFIASEESFGPVMVVSKFVTLDEALVRANATEFGLASGVFTRDISAALQTADALNAGTVFVNTYNKTDVAAPFGGFKQSGFGKDLGREALNEWLRCKTITVEY